MKYRFNKKYNEKSFIRLDVLFGLLVIIGWILFIMFVIYPNLLGSIMIGGL
jgi:hypothetical protein